MGGRSGWEKGQGGFKSGRKMGDKWEKIERKVGEKLEKSWIKCEEGQGGRKVREM